MSGDCGDCGGEAPELRKDLYARFAVRRGPMSGEAVGEAGCGGVVVWDWGGFGMGDGFGDSEVEGFVGGEVGK